MEVIKVKTEICNYFPVKKVISWYLNKPVPLFAFFGAQPKWTEYETLFSDSTTIIGRNEAGLFCDMYGYIIGDIVSSANLEKEILERKRRQEIAQKSEKKRSAGRTAVTAAVYGGYIAAQLITGNRSSASGETVRRQIDQANKSLGLKSQDIDFNEQEFRKKYVRIEGTDQWANYTPHPDFLQGQTIAGKTILRGLPSDYSGALDRRCCITYQEFEDREDRYEIMEYPDVQTAEQVWSALKSYGFV